MKKLRNIVTFTTAYVILTSVVLSSAQRNIWSGGLEVSYDSYENWAQQINGTRPFLIVYPRTSQEVVSIVTWAYTAGRQVRVQGHRHSYPPITVSNEDDPAKIVIIDMTRHLTRLRMGSMIINNPKSLNSTRLNTVIAETGASMEDFFTFSEQNMFGVVMAPIIGKDASIGGVLAIGGHGAGIPALNEKLNGPGFTFGSVSNAIVELKAVVWASNLKTYVIKTFSRSDPEISAFLVHVGRAVITEVTLMVGPNYNLRCLSRVDVPASELFAHPNKVVPETRTMTKFMDDVGRVDAIWYPFTENPWLKTWEVAPTKPLTSQITLEPYNYQFTANELNPQTPGPVFGRQSYVNLIRGLTATNKWDIYGRSKNTILYYNATSRPLAYSGFVVLTSRSNMQLVLHDLSKFYTDLLDEYGARGIYPIDSYIKLRVTGLDNPRETLIPGAIAADISPLSPIKSRPDFDVGVWMNTLSTTRRPYLDNFMQKFEQWAYDRFNGRDALVRPEWSKNWAHSSTAPFDNPTFIREAVPRVYGVQEWNRAIKILNKYDPHNVISNRFLRELMVPYVEAASAEESSAMSDNDRISVHRFGWNKDTTPRKIYS